MIKARHYDICLMDFHMPVMDGLTTTRKIREELKLDIVIIVLTGTASVEDLRAGLNSGMNSYCTKPVSIQDLARAMLVYKK
jgi:CheY-like chemotaxis protein